MKLPDTKSPEGTPPPDLWTRIVTTTPVVLAVVATVLAGLSSSEMTQAQYHRALAAQHQDKATDQWNLFQAKRIRGSSLEGVRDLLRSLAEPGPTDAAGLQASAEQLHQQFGLLTAQARQLQQALDRAKDQPAATRQAVAHLLALLDGPAAKQATAAQEQFRQELARKPAQELITQVNAQDIPSLPSHQLEDARLSEAVQLIGKHRPDAETAHLIKPLTPAAIQAAIDHSDADIRDADKVEQPARDLLQRLDELQQKAQEAWMPVQAALSAVQMQLLTLPAGDPLPRDVQTAAAALNRSAAAIKAAAAEVRVGLQAVRFGYTIQRYKNESDLNQRAALLYEVQVRKSGLRSESHRSRSLLFFIGMLAAQAGVTTASLSLAVRRKSVFWALAALMGIGSIIFSAYVYLQP
jgi:hypothetical protein